MKTEKKESLPVNMKDLRDQLKTIMQNEIGKLPEVLESMEPKERIQTIIKLMPYVFPKMESIVHDNPLEGFMS